MPTIVQNYESPFSIMFPHSINSDHIRCKTDVIIQSSYYMLHNSCRKTPFPVSISQAIHDTSCLKTLIKIMNRLRLGISYDELERIDMSC